MAPPTTIFKTFDRTIALEDVDDATKRMGTPGLGSEATVSPTGAPLDLGIVDISGGQADSTVEYMLFRITADGGNTLAEDFGVWQEAGQEGFTEAATVLKVHEIMGEDGVPDANILEYIASAVVGSYASWVTIATTEGGENVLRVTDKGTSVVLSTTSDDAVFWAHYLAVDGAELTGTYEDLSSGKEFQASFGFSYS